MKKFKVGDLVIGNEKANRYGITKENTFGLVAEVFDGCFNIVPLLETKNDYWKINTNGLHGERWFTVESDAFDLYETENKKVRFSLFD